MTVLMELWPPTIRAVAGASCADDPPENTPVASRSRPLAPRPEGAIPYGKTPGSGRSPGRPSERDPLALPWKPPPEAAEGPIPGDARYRRSAGERGAQGPNTHLAPVHEGRGPEEV